MRPILIILIGCFVCLVIFSTTSIQVVLMVQKNWSVPKPTWKPHVGRVCIASREQVQSLVAALKRDKVSCVIDWGASIGELSLPLVKSGFLVTSVGSMDLTRIRSKLPASVQQRWTLHVVSAASPSTGSNCILLNHNPTDVEEEIPTGLRVINICS